MKLVNKLKKGTLTIASGVFLSLTSTSALAAGLSAGTDELNALKTWLYGALGVIAFIYLMYYVVMAKLEKKQWGDVLMALVQVSLAGGALTAVSWAWAIFA
ncbi:TrbC/VirB2 family protein [Enterovibrio calviensis]|uniref:TrbC/VirB2 family protein n=1 Tax=Enterovibrio calviensis TaxID=91359 RepID=UPI0037357D58